MAELSLSKKSDRSLQEVIEQAEELQFNLNAGTPQGTSHLWGFCKTCKFAELCRGGCTSGV